MQIGHKIKKLRELKNFTQKHVAEGIGVTQGAYSKVEQGDSEITYSKLEKIAEILQLLPQDIINFNESVVFNYTNIESTNELSFNTLFTQEEKKLYQDQIELLKQEVVYLKALLDKILSKFKEV